MTPKEEEKGNLIEGIIFVSHTEKSQLAKRIREKLEMLEKLSNLSVRVVERAGEKIEDILHKSNPWEGVNCGRKGCIFCESGEEKLVGKCKQRNVVYENECLLCKEEGKEKLKCKENINENMNEGDKGENTDNEKEKEDKKEEKILDRERERRD